MKKTICHITSVHPWNDARIFHKECCSLAKAGFDVHLVAPDGPTEMIKGVHVHGVQKSAGGRLSRMTKTVYLAYQAAASIDADFYHIHDPELLPAGLMLKMKGKKVIFDMHENVAAQIRDKAWIPYIFRGLLSNIYELFQVPVLVAFHNIILAESCYNDVWLPGCKTTTVRNFPMLSEFTNRSTNLAEKENAVCYVGGITYIRGLKEMVVATKRAEVKLILAGPCSEETLGGISNCTEWCSTDFLGRVDRNGVASILSRSFAGLVVLHPVPNYIATEPTKMFEYMAAGIPVIASNFPLWQRIIEENDCGICVNPLKVDDIAEAIIWLKNHPVEAKRMGENGRRAVEEKYTWEREGEKLIALYTSLIDRDLN